MQGLRGDCMGTAMSQTASENVEKIVFKKQSQAKEVWRMYKKNKGAMIGLVLFSFILLMLAAADFIIPYSAATKGVFSQINQPPSAAHHFRDGFLRSRRIRQSFIAVAEHLCLSRYSQPCRLA